MRCSTFPRCDAVMRLHGPSYIALVRRGDGAIRVLRVAPRNSRPCDLGKDRPCRATSRSPARLLLRRSSVDRSS